LAEGLPVGVELVGKEVGIAAYRIVGDVMKLVTKSVKLLKN
jgi:hypothetical protein